MQKAVSPHEIPYATPLLPPAVICKAGKGAPGNPILEMPTPVSKVMTPLGAERVTSPVPLHVIPELAANEMSLAAFKVRVELVAQSVMGSDMSISPLPPVPEVDCMVTLPIPSCVTKSEIMIVAEAPTGSQ